MSRFKRILLKLSGESLMGKQSFGIDPVRLGEYAQQIKEVHEMGVQIGIVIGGGNIFRGLSGASKGFDRVKGDQMGMCATVINSLALSSALGAIGVKTKVLTAIRMEPIGEFYSKWKAIEAMEAGYVCIFSAGTGSPYFTTDTGSSLRGIEIEADVMLKGTRVDGIYTAEAMGFEGEITVQVTVAEDKITDITLLSAEDEEEYLSRAKQVIPAILEGQSPNVDAVSGATYSSTGILNAVKLALAKAAVAPAEEAEPEQAASEEAAEEAVLSEAAKPEETPVTAPTVEVVQPEEKSAVSAWFKEVWQQLFPAETPDDSEPEPASSAEVLPTSETALPPEETETEPETEGAAE